MAKHLGLKIEDAPGAAELAQAAVALAKQDFSGGAIARLSQRHHNLALVIAKGRSPSEAAFIVGYDVGQVRRLLDDPTFKELIAYYAAESAPVRDILMQRIEGISLEATEELLRRFEDEEQRAKIPTALLQKLAEAFLDRSGFAPETRSTTNVNVNIGIGDRLANARKRIEEAKFTVVEAAE